jgi:hypothetical protein
MATTAHPGAHRIRRASAKAGEGIGAEKMKVTSLKTTSVGFGAGAAKAQPARIAMPTTTKPDRVDPNDQHNKNQELKAGRKGPDQAHNPGRKRAP